MTAYNLELVFRGRDNVSGVIGGILNSFSRIGQVAGGIITARLLWGIADGIRDIGVAAIDSTAMVQRMQVTLESLLARDYIQAQWVEGASSIGTYSQAIQAVAPHAAELMESLAHLAILSPFTYEAVTMTFKQAMAFGFAADEAEMFTKATLNMAAGIGASNDMLDRMAYNLAQIRLQGKVTALDVRQLALAGFDLRSVLRYVGQQMGVTVKDIGDFNSAIASGKISWEDFTRLYAEYADKYFGGASERLARTLSGLKSTFSDVFALTMPKMLGPAAEAITDFLNKVLNDFISLRDSGVLDEIGRRWGESTSKWLVGVEEVYWKLKRFVELITTAGMSLGQALVWSSLIPPGELASAIDNIATKIGELGTKFREFVDKLPDVNFWELVGKAIIYISNNFDTFAAVLGVLAASRVVGVIISIGAALVGLATSLLSPITILIGLLGLLYVAWTQNWGGIQEKLSSVSSTLLPVLGQIASSIATAFSNAWKAIQPFIANLRGLFEVHIPDLIKSFATAFQILAPVIQAVMAAIGPAIQRFADSMVEVWPRILQGLNGFLTFLEFLIPVIAGVIVFIVGIFAGLVSGIITAVGTIEQVASRLMLAFQGIFAGVAQVFQGLWDVIAGIFTLNGTRILDGLSGIVYGILGIFVNLATAILLIIIQPFAAVLSFIGGFVDGVIQFFTTLFNALVGQSIIPDLVNAIVAAFLSMTGLIGEMFVSLIELILTPLQTLGAFIATTVVNAFSLWISITENLKTSISGAAAVLKNNLFSALSAVYNMITNLIDKVFALASAFAKLVIPSIFERHSPSEFEVALAASTKQMTSLMDAMSKYNTMTLNPVQPGSAWPVQGGAEGSSEFEGTGAKQIIFQFKDTNLDMSTLAYALNKVMR